MMPSEHDTDKTVAIIQARMGSSRLPGKVLMPLLERPVLFHIVDRLNRVTEINEVVVATSIETQDDQIDQFCSDNGIPVFRGSESDVLDRFYQAAVRYKASTVLRITGDCPLVDPEVIASLISFFRTSDYDYCGIAAGAGVSQEVGINRFPDGLDGEIMTMSTLASAWQEAGTQQQREHVTPFIWRQPGRFRLGSLYSKNGDFSKQRWTLDNEEDFSLINWIYAELYPTKPGFTMLDVLELLHRHPEKQLSNMHLMGQEGYDAFWSDE